MKITNISTNMSIEAENDYDNLWLSFELSFLFHVIGWLLFSFLNPTLDTLKVIIIFCGVAYLVCCIYEFINNIFESIKLPRWTRVVYVILSLVSMSSLMQSFMISIFIIIIAGD